MQRLLIVDDETPMAEALATLFSAEQIPAMNVADRGAAEELIQGEFFAVILADVRLKTEEEGLQLLDSIRKLSPESKVASLTGYATPALEEQLRARGAELVVYKPVDFDELLRVVRQLLGGGAEESDSESAALVDFEQLYEKVRGLLHALPGRRYGLSGHETEEIVQEAWCLFLENQAVIRQPKSWLAGTVVNLCKQQIQQKLKKRGTETDLLLAADAPAGAVDRDGVIAVRQALARVDDRTRTLCRLIGMEKRSYEEVSSELGLPVGSIGPLYIRAKAKLRSAMSN